VGQATTYVARVGPGTKPDGFGTPGDRPKNQQENDDLMGLNHDSLWFILVYSWKIGLLPAKS